MSLIGYTCPKWASRCSSVPQQIIKLARTPTPIESWNLSHRDPSFSVYIKRDDMTGSTLSGNKVRKLEFILAEAIKRKCKRIITCGAVQSNHCRAVSAACAQLGLKAHIYLRSNTSNIDEIPREGNYLLNILTGASQYIIERKSPYLTHIKPKMEKLAQQIQSEWNESSYIMPVGGSDSLGVWGYMEAFHEIQQQIGDGISDIICVCGSGGTAAGLSIANHLAGNPYKIHGISVCDSMQYFYQHIQEMLDSLNITEITSTQLITIHDDYRGLGYGRSLPREIELITSIARSTGIILDTVYTGKAVYGLNDLVKNKPGVFKGRQLLFIHSGGLLGINCHSVSDELVKSALQHSTVQNWNNH